MIDVLVPNGRLLHLEHAQGLLLLGALGHLLGGHLGAKGGYLDGKMLIGLVSLLGNL